MKFPLRVRFRRVEVMIYGRTKGYDFYRVAWHAAGRRRLRSFGRLADARAFAERTARELAAGNQAPALSVQEAADALTVRQALTEFARETGRRVTPVQAIAEYLDALRRLPPRARLADAVTAYLQHAIIRPRRLAEAVEEFCATRRAKGATTVAGRPGLAPQYLRDSERYVRLFAEAFPNYGLGDLTKDHLDQYIASLTSLAPKTRNSVRTVLAVFLRWCVRRDYLPADARLLAAEGLRAEPLPAKPIEHFNPDELRRLLGAADDEMRPIMALQALGGLRLQEALRLDWRDVWRVPGHVEVSSAKAKTRQRRLVEVCPALAAWLAPYRERTEGPLTLMPLGTYAGRFTNLRVSLGLPSKPNGLRHGFVTYHLALHTNENLTAAQAGNSPAMIHAHYRGLATKAEAEEWFSVMP